MRLIASRPADLTAILVVIAAQRKPVATVVEAGLHVLCEKPLARSADDARQMLQAVEAAGSVHMVMFTWRWLGVFSYAQRLLASGYIGLCRDARFVMSSDHACDPSYAWRFDPRRGSGVIGNFGSHMIDLARWYLGDVAWVAADLVAHVKRPGTDGVDAGSLDDSAMVLLEFVGGARASIDLSAARMVGELPTQHVWLYGDEGSLEATVENGEARLRGRRRSDSSWQELPVPADLTGLPAASPPILGVDVHAPLTSRQVGDRLFVDACLGQARAEPSFVDGWQTQKVVDAAVMAHREGCWVPVS